MDDQQQMDEKTLKQLQRMAYWMDDRFSIPGTGWRVGLDGLIGLIPGIGDVATGLLSGYIIYQAKTIGIPRRILAKMVGNTVLDTVFGSVPLVGDLFDVGWKVNKKNVALLMREMEKRKTFVKATGTGHARAGDPLDPQKKEKEVEEEI